MLERAIKSVRELRTLAQIREHLDSQTEGAIGIGLLQETGTADAEALAYIWMAVESDLNILINGDSDSGKVSFMYSLYPFIPSYDRTLTFGCHSKTSRYYDNFISMVSDKPADLKNTLQTISALSTNRVIVAAVGPFCKEIFRCANRGIPFITAIDCGNDKIIETLEKMHVGPNTLSMLDIAITFRNSGNPIWTLSSISEYHWFNRSEYNIDEAIVTDNFRYKEVKIIDENGVNLQGMALSKVLLAYSNLNVVSKKEAMAEYEKRCGFLKDAPKEAAQSKEYVDSYWEIR